MFFLCIILVSMYTLKFDEQQLSKLKEKYERWLDETVHRPYLLYSFALPNAKIDVYKKNKKGYHSVNFYGSDAYSIAKEYDENIISNNDITDAKNDSIYDLGEQCGSDEVGAGDFFGPLIVTAVYLDEKETRKYIKLGFTDSKKLNDAWILKNVPKILKSVRYSSLTLDNKKYNELVAKGLNLNELKAILHNRALYNLHERYPEVKHFYVDKFCSEQLFYKYIKDETKQMNSIVFKVHGESHYPSIAIASCIARYSFLKHKSEMEKRYHFSFPNGASEKVIQAGISFKKEFGREKFNDVAKLHFKTLKTILERDENDENN